jgi:hypothetical protein
MSIVAVLPTTKGKSPRRNFLNPESCAVTSYLPGTTLVAKYVPSLLLVVLYAPADLARPLLGGGAGRQKGQHPREERLPSPMASRLATGHWVPP